MSDVTKHLLLAFLAGLVVCTLLALTSIVPPVWDPILSFAAAFATHYYLENAPAGSPSIPGAPATGPPAITLTRANTLDTTTPTPAT